MKLLVGLGNPGELYMKNRHNVGFLFLDYLAGIEDGSFPDKTFAKKTFERNVKLRGKICRVSENYIFLKPQTYMNKSGESVSKTLNYYKIVPVEILVAHDDLDIPFGSFKIQQSKGPKVHNGLSSIEQSLGTADFWRIRIGIENRDSHTQISGHDYVLSNFTNEERQLLPSVFEKILEQVKERKLFNNY